MAVQQHSAKPARAVPERPPTNPQAPPSAPAAPGSISGSVVDERGAPVVGAIVNIVAPADAPMAQPDGPSGPTSAQPFQIAPSPGQNLGVTSGDVPVIPLLRDDGPALGGLASALMIQTGSDGLFRIYSIPPSTVLVMASAPGYTTVRSRPITLSPGASVTDVEVVLSQSKR